MNNIRNIITERLDNARNDYECHRHINLKDSPIIVSLESEIQTYQDCLNLIPAPRTEADILKDFEKLGYKITHINTKLNEVSYLKNPNTNIEINIDRKNKWYSKYDNNSWDLPSISITMQEHKLLNELFEVWQWI